MFFVTLVGNSLSKKTSALILTEIRMTEFYLQPSASYILFHTEEHIFSI